MRLTRHLRLFLDNKNAVPNQRPGSLWQDPIFGYFETHGKMEFKPGEEYDLTDEQKKAVMERYLKKERLKREYLSLQYNPQRFNYIEGVIVDPALFRWYATDMSHLERFRVTPRTGLLIIATFCVFFWVFNRIGLQPLMVHDDRSRKGELLWWDRGSRWISESGVGECSTGQIC